MKQPLWMSLGENTDYKTDENGQRLQCTRAACCMLDRWGAGLKIVQ